MVDLVDLKLEDFQKYTFSGICCPCRIIDIYDGDTCDIGIKLDNRYIQIRLRLKDINCAELKPKHDIRDRDHVIEKAYLAKTKLIEYCTSTSIPISPENCKSRLECHEIMEKNRKILYTKLYDFDSFGRVIAELFLDHEYKQSVNQLMIDNGYAVRYVRSD